MPGERTVSDCYYLWLVRRFSTATCKKEQGYFPETLRFEKIDLERKICVFFGCVEEIGGDNRLEMRRYFCSVQGNVFPSGKIEVRAGGFIASRRVLRYCSGLFA